MFVRIRSRVRASRDRGASAVEYGLLVAAIAAVIVTTVFALGTVVKGAFRHSCDAIAASPVGGDCAAPAGGGQVPPGGAQSPVAP